MLALLSRALILFMAHFSLVSHAQANAELDEKLTRSYWQNDDCLSSPEQTNINEWNKINFNNVNLGFVKQICWIKVKLKNNAEASDWFLTLDNTRLDFVDFYLFADSKVITYHSGDHSDLSKQLSAYPTFKFRLAEQQHAEIFIRIDSSAQVSFSPAIRSSYEYGLYQAQRNYTHILYVVIFMLFLLFQFSVNREGMKQANVWYSLGLLFGFLYILFCYGEGNLLLFPTNITIKNQALFILGSLSMLSFTQFVRLFIDSRRKQPKLDKLIRGYIVLCGIITLILAMPVANMTRVYLLAFECNLTCLILLTAAFTSSFKEKSLWSRFISWPLMFSAISIIIYEATLLGLLPFSEITAKLILWSMPFDVLLISMSFFYKYKAIQENNTQLLTKLKSLSELATQQSKVRNDSKVVNSGSSIAPRLRNVDSEKVLVDLAQYLESNKVLTETGISLEMVANELGLRRDQLSAVINSQLNTSFSNLVNQKRLEKAAGMLITEEQESILNISVRCGFGSKSNFNKLFKNQFEITPSQYRKIYKQG